MSSDVYLNEETLRQLVTEGRDRRYLTLENARLFRQVYSLIMNFDNLETFETRSMGPEDIKTYLENPAALSLKWKDLTPAQQSNIVGMISGTGDAVKIGNIKSSITGFVNNVTRIMNLLNDTEKKDKLVEYLTGTLNIEQ